MDDPRLVTSIGLGMDIVGILLLFFCGAIGGKWMEEGDGYDYVHPHHPIRRKRHWARWGAGFGLALAVLGFALQIYAQWL